MKKKRIIIIIIVNNRSRNRLVKRGDMRDKIEFAFLCNPLKERFIRDILERFRNKFNERVRNLLANQFKQEQRGGGLCVISRKFSRRDRILRDVTSFRMQPRKRKPSTVVFG